MLKWVILFISLIFSVGCENKNISYDLSNMDNHIIYAFKKKRIVLYDRNSIVYPKIQRNFGYIRLGDGLLFYKLNKIISTLGIPPGKKARVLIKTTKNILLNDMLKSLRMFDNIVVSKDRSMIDFTFIVHATSKDSLSLTIYRGNKKIKKYKKISIKKLEELANSNAYITVAIKSAKYKIQQRVVSHKNFDGYETDAMHISFKDEEDYCRKKSMRSYQNFILLKKLED